MALPPNSKKVPPEGGTNSVYMKLFILACDVSAEAFQGMRVMPGYKENLPSPKWQRETIRGSVGLLLCLTFGSLLGLDGQQGYNRHN